MMAPPDTSAAQAWLQKQNLADQAKWLTFFNNAPFEIVSAARNGRLKGLESIVADLLKPQEALVQAGRWDALLKSEKSLSMEDLFVTLQKWLFDLSRCAVGLPPRYFQHHEKPMQMLAGRTGLLALLEAQKQIAQLRGLVAHPLNPRLFLEDVCVRAFRPLSS